MTTPKSSHHPEIKKPALYVVLMHKDQTTPYGFVLNVLMDQFNLYGKDPFRILTTADREGQAVVAILPRDLAISKAASVTAYARRQKNPHFKGQMELTFTAEPA